MKFHHHVTLALLTTFFTVSESTAQFTDTTKANTLTKSIKFVIQIKGFDTAALQIDTAYAIYKNVFGQESEQAALLLHYRGLNFYAHSMQDSAVKWYNASLEIRKCLRPVPHLDIAQSYNNLGLAYTEMGRYWEALNYHEKALELRRKYLPDGVEMAHSWGNIGQVKGFLGEYYPAESYCRLALERLSAAKEPLDWVSIASVQNNLAGVFLASNELDSAIVWFDIAQKNWNKIDPLKQSTAKIFATIAQNKCTAYMKKKQFKKAKETLLPAIRLYEKKKPDPNLIELYNAMAGIFVETKTPDSAFYFARKSIQTSEKIFGKGHWSSGQGYVNLTSAYSFLQHRQPEMATSLIDSAFIVLGCDRMRPSRLIPDIENIFVQRKWNIDDPVLFDSVLTILGIKREFGNIVKKTTLLDAAKIYTETCLVIFFSNEEETNYLRKATIFARVIDRYFDYCRATLPDPESRQLLQSFAYFFYERAIYVQHVCDKIGIGGRKPLEQAFYFAEKSKGLSLFEAMRSIDPSDIRGVDSTLLALEKAFRVDVANAEKEYFLIRDADTGKHGGEIESAVIKLSKKRIALDSILQRLNQNEKFNQARQNIPPISLQGAQKAFCNDSTTLLSWVYGDTSVFAFVLNKEDAFFTEIRKCSGLDTLIQDFKAGLEAPADKPEYAVQSKKWASHKKLAASASKLYQFLIAPIEDQIKTNVVVIQDGPLGVLPFEALLTQKPGNEDLEDPSLWPYFILNHSIIYGNSVGLLNEMRNHQINKNPDKAFAGFAPWYKRDPKHLKNCNCDDFGIGFFNHRSEFDTLPYSGEELYCIGKEFPGAASLWYGPDAHLKQFMKIASDYSILHLSTHAQANEKIVNDAYISFDSVSKLYIRDLYNMKLNAALVTLSACKTGNGNYRRGEGVISLARGFAMAGAKSILYGIWYIDDAASRSELIRFYQEARSGKYSTKSVALAAAKRNAIADVTYAHPYYWAGLLLNGDDSPLEK